MKKKKVTTACADEKYVYCPLLPASPRLHRVKPSFAQQIRSCDVSVQAREL